MKNSNTALINKLLVLKYDFIRGDKDALGNIFRISQEKKTEIEKINALKIDDYNNRLFFLAINSVKNENEFKRILSQIYLMS